MYTGWVNFGDLALEFTLLHFGKALGYKDRGCLAIQADKDAY